MAAVATFPVTQESASALARRLSELMEHNEQDHMPEPVRDQVVVLLDVLRARVIRKPERDHRSLFELDDRLIELMGQVEEAADAGTEITKDLAEEIDTYLDAHRRKVDLIVGYWRWQQSIADISGKEAERLAARKRAAENRVSRLKGFLLGFMSLRGIKKLEGEKSDIAIQRNSTASLVINDPLLIPDQCFERSIRFTKAELREVSQHLTEGDLLLRIVTELKSGGWEVNGDGVRALMSSNMPAIGARLVTGSHLRIR